MFGRIDDSDSAFDIKCWKDVLEIRNGRDYKNVPSESGLYPVYGSGGIMTYVDEYLCPDNTVIIGRKGTINNPILVKEKFWNVDTAFGLIPKSELIDAVYLYWFCQFYDFNRHNKATTLPSLTKTDLYNIEMKVPPISYQQEFSSFVEQVDKSKLIFQQLVSQYDELIKSRFIEMFGDWNNGSEYPEMTMSQVCANIVDCPHSTPKYSDSVTIYPTITTTDIVGGQIVWNQMKYVDEIQYNDRIKRLRPQENDIVLGREGTIGEVALLPPGYAFCLGQRVMLLRANQTVVNPMFLCHVFQSNYVQTIFKSKNTGSTVNHVNVKDVVQLKVYVPPMELQNQFADFVRQVDKSKSNLLCYINMINNGD